MTKEQQEHALRELEDMVAFYSEAPEGRRGVDALGGCLYRVSGRYCAVGRRIDWKRLDAEDPELVQRLLDDNPPADEYLCDLRDGLVLDDLLVEDARGLPVAFWRSLQIIHDGNSCWTRHGLSTIGSTWMFRLRSDIEENRL